MTPFAQGLIGTGVSLLGNLVGQGMTYKNNKKLMAQQQEYNRQNAEWQNQVNIANWQMQNEYNTPAAQLQRLQEAGLNPNLLYGNGTTSTGNNSSAPSAADVAAYIQQPTNFADMGSADAVRAFNQIRQTAYQDELSQSQASKLQAEEILALRRAATEKNNNLLRNVEYLSALNQLDVDKTIKDDVIRQWQLNNALTESKISSIEQGNTESKQRIEESRSRIQLQSTQRDELVSRIGVNQVQALSIQQGINESAQRIVESISRTKGNQLDNEFKSRSMESRVDTVAAALQDCLTRTANGAVELDMKLFDQKVQQITGVKSNSTLQGAISGSLYNALKWLWQ